MSLLGFARRGPLLLFSICCIMILLYNNINLDHYFSKLDIFIRKDKKLIIYDFDKTLTVKPLYGMLKKQYSASTETDQLNKLTKINMIDIFGGNNRIQRLHLHLHLLRQYNVDIAVLSFGWDKVINHALKQMNLSQYFDIIIGRNGLNISQAKNANIDGDGNNIQLSMHKVKSIQNDFKQYNANNILFVDDTWANMQLASEYNVCRILNHQFHDGLNDTDLSMIELYVTGNNRFL